MALFQESKAAKRQLTEERLKFISQEGRPGFIDQTLGRGAYMEEYKKRRDDINRGYMLQKRAFRKEWKKKEKELYKGLGKQEHKIYEGRYHISSLRKREDPRLERMETMADKRYGLVSKVRLRHFLEAKKEHRKALAKQRKEQMSESSAELRSRTRLSELGSLKSPAFGADPRTSGTPTPKGAQWLQ